MQKLVAFDLEIAKVLPEGETDWGKHRPLGISCAAMLSTGENPSVDDWEFIWQGQPKLSQDACRDIVEKMLWLVDRGHTVVTVNGLSFDFQILAEESGLWLQCADVALNHHCDLMFMSVCDKGWRTGLDAFARGAGIESKLKQVVLKDGRVLEGMDGAKAPELWAAGEHEAVLSYLKQDVVATLGVAETAVAHKRLSWTSSAGRDWFVRLNLDGTLPTVREMLAWPRRDTSWMDDPPDPDEMAGWIMEVRNE